MFPKLLLFFCSAALASSLHPDIPNVSIKHRIIGGENATRGEFPHMVSLQLPYIGHECGGSILNEYWILTAAHCYISGYGLVVKAGKHTISDVEESEQTINVEEFYVHENLDPSNPTYDIALLKLETPLRFNTFVQPIKLPEKGSEVSGDVVLVGWGVIDNGEYNPAEVLQKATLPIIDRETCSEIINELPSPNHPQVSDAHICTGPLTGGISGCNGDSGGPLMKFKEDGRPEIVGIVSWGKEPCGIEVAIAIYTRVSSYIDWIEATMNET